MKKQAMPRLKSFALAAVLAAISGVASAQTQDPGLENAFRPLNVAIDIAIKSCPDLGQRQVLTNQANKIRATLIMHWKFPSKQHDHDCRYETYKFIRAQFDCFPDDPAKAQKQAEVDRDWFEENRYRGE